MARLLIDSHCHLDSHHFPEGPEPILARGQQAGVGHFVVMGVARDDSIAQMVVSLAEARTDVSAAVGMHPHDADCLDEALFERLEQLCRRDVVVAVGEVGLDFHYMHSPAEKQQQVFVRMIDLAKRLGKPLIVHTRNAAEQTLRILRDEDAAQVGGIIHCFSEDRSFAKRALDLDFDLSFSGIVTFPKAHGVHEVARWAPAERIMVETDSPYLAPAPKRGRRNEPANVVEVAKAVAALRNEPLEQLASQTTANVVRRLRLDRPDEG